MKCFFLIISLIPLSAVSQSSQIAALPEHTDSKWQLLNVDLMGGYRDYVFDGSKLGLRYYVKDSDYLVNTDFNYYPYAVFSRSRAGSFNGALNFGFSTGKKHREVRMGLNYSSYSSFWSRNEIQSVITTKDSFELHYPDKDPSMIYLDSIWSDIEGLHFTQSFASVSGEYVLKTERTRVSGHAGFGAQFGVSIQQSMLYSRYQSYGYRYVDSNGYQVFQNNYVVTGGVGGIYPDQYYIDGEHFEIDAKTAFLIAPYLPVGIEYAPFMKQNFLSRFGLELKGLIGAEFHLLRKAPVEMRPFYSFNFGLKYYLR